MSGGIAYKRGVRDYENCWWSNPYPLGSHNRQEWDRGHADAEAAAAQRYQAQQDALKVRKAGLFFIPEHAMDEYMAMEDICGEEASRAIAMFVKAICKIED